MNYPPYFSNPNDPNDPYSQPTTAGQYQQWGQSGQPGQPSNMQWGQQIPPPPPQFPQQPGQFSQSGQNFPQYTPPYPQPGQFVPPPPPPGQPVATPSSIKPCSDVVLSFLFLFDIIGWICAFVPGGVGIFGKSVLTSIVFIMLIIDWKGVITFDSKINWKKFSGGKRVILFCLYLVVLPFALLGYFVRRINASTEAKKQNLPALPYRKGRPALAIGVGIFVFIFALAANAAPAPDTTATTTVASAPTQQVAHTAPTKVPTQKPTATPTPSPTPTATPTPEPTQPPVQQQSQPQQSQPQQSAPPPATGVNGNPWGYDFNPGNYIYSPPSTFCSYFNCIASFWNGKGYVEECSDATYSKSGGRSGSCSDHGGNWRPLYSH